MWSKPGSEFGLKKGHPEVAFSLLPVKEALPSPGVFLSDNIRGQPRGQTHFYIINVLSNVKQEFRYLCFST
jgi:hypothetical protein